MLEVPRSELVSRGNVSVVAASQSCSSFLSTRGGMARLSWPRATVCKFHAQRNYAVTRVFATGFEPGTIRLRIQPATTATKLKSHLFFHPDNSDYCTGEEFRPRCSGGGNRQIIAILSARYGRMKFGRCVKEDRVFESLFDDPRFIGCSEDVRRVLDQKCSGQSECRVHVTNNNFDGVSPCHDDLRMYLEASYTCIHGKINIHSTAYFAGQKIVSSQALSHVFGTVVGRWNISNANYNINLC